MIIPVYVYSSIHICQYLHILVYVYIYIYIYIFDIREFYPSITENLLKKPLNLAKAHTHLSDDDKAFIHHVRK